MGELEESGDEPHEIKHWTEELILLVVKYFCPMKVKLVTIGCYYAHSQEPLEVMLAENWLQSRLKQLAQEGVVAPPPADLQCECFEEYNYEKPAHRFMKRS